MSKLKKNSALGIIAGILSVLFVVVLFLAVQRLVMPKYSSELPEGNFTSEYYSEKTDHDVLIVGDCEVYENIDTMYLWKKYGITSYIRGNAQQLAWQSYYMLEDTLKYEKPRVVIYNVQALQHATPQKEEYNRMTLDGMRWSETKLNAIKASMCDGESLVDYVFPLFRYHSRALELGSDDFKYYFQNKKVAHNGYYMRVDVLPVSESDVADTSWLFGDDKQEEEAVIDDPWGSPEKDVTEEGMGPLAASSTEGKAFGDMPMEYLKKMTQLCKDEGIELILMKAPSLSPIWYSSDEEQVVEFAKKNNLRYINFYELIDELEIDYETDTYDGGLHMNLSGADKVADYIGQILTKEYGIKNHSDDADISKVYKEKYKFYETMIEKQKEEIDKYGEVVSY